jgi:hypothetical protein
LGDDYESDFGQLITASDALNLATALRRSATNARLLQEPAAADAIVAEAEPDWPPPGWCSLPAGDPLREDLVRWANAFDPERLVSLAEFLSGGAAHIYASTHPESLPLHVLSIAAQRQELQLADIPSTEPSA